MGKNTSNLSAEFVDKLLATPKWVLENGEKVKQKIIDQTYPFDKRIKLISEDKCYSFLLEISQSKKDKIRVSLHFQENTSKVGLFRVDYNSGHKNPEHINEHVPERFHRYKGSYFKAEDGGHAHYNVKGYRSLAWAIPLTDDDFEIKGLKDSHLFNSTLSKIIAFFVERLNIQSDIQINELAL